MRQRLILFFIFCLILLPLISAYCAPSELYCDNSYQDILKCDEEGNQKFVYEECSQGCQLTSEGPVCKEHLMNQKPASSFILPGIIILVILIGIGFYIKVLKSKSKP